MMSIAFIIAIALLAILWLLGFYELPSDRPRTFSQA